MMKALRQGILNTLKAAKNEEQPGKLVLLGNQMRDLFNKQLGGTDLFATKKNWSGGLLHTVANESGIAVMYYLGGTLQLMSANQNGKSYYRVVGGNGRAFKFMEHLPHEPVEKDDFFGIGFPYQAKELMLSTVTGGTVARVKGSVAPVFSIDTVSRVTTDGIDDIRTFGCGGKLSDKVQLLFEETISNVAGEWDRIFRLLHSR